MAFELSCKMREFKTLCKKRKCIFFVVACHKSKDCKRKVRSLFVFAKNKGGVRTHIVRLLRQQKGHTMRKACKASGRSAASCFLRLVFPTVCIRSIFALLSRCRTAICQKQTKFSVGIFQKVICISLPVMIRLLCFARRTRTECVG